MIWPGLGFVIVVVLGPACSSMQAQTAPMAPAQAPEGIRLSIAEAEAIALRNNPRITIGKLRALVALQYVRETRSTLLPTASLNVTGVDSQSGSRIAAGFLNSPSLFTRAAAGTAVTQLITDFGRTTNLLASSEFQAKAEDKNAGATTADIILAVDQAFYHVLETSELVKVAQQTLDTRQTVVDKVQALTDAKLKSDLDLSFAKVDLARAKLLLLEAQNNFQASLAGLSAILGYQEEQKFQLFEPTMQVAPPAVDPLPLILLAVAGELLFRSRFLRIPRLATILRCAMWCFFSSISLLRWSACSDLAVSVPSLQSHFS